MRGLRLQRLAVHEAQYAGEGLPVHGVRAGGGDYGRGPVGGGEGDFGEDAGDGEGLGL